MMKSLFGQFSPDLMGWLPLHMISSFLAVSWLLFIFQTNNFGNRINYFWLIFRFEAIKLLFQSSKMKSASWLPLLTSLFFLMISMKLIGMLPYGFTSTTHVSMSYSLAIPLWLSVKIMGFYLSFNKRLSHLVPQGTPAGLIPLMVWIETMSLFAQPLALGLRMAAKLTAGHLLMFLLSTATWVLSSSLSLSFLILMILMLLFILEMGVACVQAYVFTSLSHFYLDSNI